MLGNYEDTLLEHGILLAQPALSPGSRTYHHIPLRQEESRLRFTDFVEIGPLVSIKSRYL